MRVGSLFAGMGGFDLAARWMGWSTAWYSEVDPFACRVMAHHFPEATSLGDITRVDWYTVAPIDLLVGGFPCQPASMAGNRKGQDDDRWLWPEFARAIRGTRPRWIVGENVRGLLSVGGGAAFGEVLRDLARLGYDAEWRVLSAADVGAPHRRERVWITAWLADAERQGERGRRIRGPAEDRGTARGGASGQPCGRGDGVGDAASGGRRAGAGEPLRRVDGGGAGLGDADQQRREERQLAAVADGAVWAGGRGGALGWADAIPVRGHDGTVRLIPADAATRGPESPLWPVADGVPGRVARLRAIGNAIVPACAVEIFRAIEARERGMMGHQEAA